MVAVVSVPVLHGNVQTGPNITDYGWDSRVSDQVALVTNAAPWLFFAVEMHNESGVGLPQGADSYFLGKLGEANPAWQLARGEADCAVYFRADKVSLVAKRLVRFAAGSRGLTDYTFADVATGLQFHGVVSWFQNDDIHGDVKGAGKDRTRERKAQARELARYVDRLGVAFVCVDMNNSTDRKGWPRDIMVRAGWRGLRQRGTVTNEHGSTGSGRDGMKDYWSDDIFTRTDQAVTGAALVATNGASDHQGWLKATIGFDTAGTPALPRPRIAPPPGAYAPPPPYSGRPWTAVVRDRSLRYGGNVHFSTATLVENWPVGPDGLTITGMWADTDEAFSPGFGIALFDDRGVQRFTGHLVDYDELGSRRRTLIYASDVVRLWWNLCRPNPSGAWVAAEQTVPADVQVGAAETRLLAYVNRNLGPAARAERREPLLRVPATASRGPNGATTALPASNVGDTVAVLAEAAEVRVRVVHTIDQSGPHFDLVLDDALDLTDWAQFAIPEVGGPYLIGPDWHVRGAIPTATTVLSLAGEAGARVLSEKTDDDAQNLWRARVEQLLDQTGTTNATEIANGMTDALEVGAAPSEVALPISRANGLASIIPLGAEVAGLVHGVPEFARIRQITSTVAKTEGGSTLTVTGTIGPPDGLPTVDQRRIALAVGAAKKGQRL